MWQMLLPFFVVDVIATIDVGRCYCHVLLTLLPFLWLMLLPLFVVGRCCCHIWLMLLPLFCLLMVPCLADVIAILWLMLLPLFVVGRCCCHVWLMLLPLFLFIDGTSCATVAIVMPHCGSIVFFWQILLPGLADVITICSCVADVIANMADVIAIISCCVRQMLFARVADGIAYPGGCGV